MSIAEIAKVIFMNALVKKGKIMAAISYVTTEFSS